METLYRWVLSVLAIIVSAFVGSFLASYMKRKGENLATHEDLQKLVDQMRATTEATKAIEARISQDVWDRQRRWEMKRDVLQGFVIAAYAADEALLKLKNASEASRSIPFPGEVQDDLVPAVDAATEALQKLEQQRLLALLACGPAFNESAHRLNQLAKEMYERISAEPGAYESQRGAFKTAIGAAFAAARSEIGYTAEPERTL